jgi:hypothetical protein
VKKDGMWAGSTGKRQEHRSGPSNGCYRHGLQTREALARRQARAFDPSDLRAFGRSRFVTNSVPEHSRDGA